MILALLAVGACSLPAAAAVAAARVGTCATAVAVAIIATTFAAAAARYLQGSTSLATSTRTPPTNTADSEPTAAAAGDTPRLVRSWAPRTTTNPSAHSLSPRAGCLLRRLARTQLAPRVCPQQPLAATGKLPPPQHPPSKQRPPQSRPATCQLA